MRYLGQHFLKDKNIVKKIAGVAELSKDDTVLEIGPGKGILTEELLNRAGRVFAVEKDKKLCEFLKDKFRNEIKKRELVLVEGDALKIFHPSGGRPQGDNFQSISWWTISKFTSAANFGADARISNSKSQILNKSKIQNDNTELKFNNNVKILPWQDFDIFFSGIKNYKIVANIPYYITSRFLKIFLEDAKIQPQKMVLLVQKEVAERICKTPPKSVLAVSVQIYGMPKIAFKISAKNFSPPPKVQSAVITIDNISKKLFNGMKESDFFTIVKAGFAKKRKFLINNLSEGLKISKTETENVFDKCGIGLKVRAEEVRLEEWQCLMKELKVKK